MKAVGLPASVYNTQIAMIKEISEHITIIKKNADEMLEARKKANNIENMRSKAVAYCDKVRSYFDLIRYHVDKLELIVDDENWPLPKYREMVSIR
jgi:glutamine synthetase